MKGVKKIVRHYWKYSETPNATVVGTPTITNGVVSNFSTNNYLKLLNTFAPSPNSWKILTKITTGSSITNNESIFASENSGGDALWLELRTGGHFGVALTNVNYSWNIANHVIGSHTISTNTTYWVSLEFTGTQYLLKYSTDGTNYITDITVNSTASIRSLPLLIGIVKGGDGYKLPFNGSVDLNNSLIYINNSIWWRGTTIVPATQDDYDLYTDDEVTLLPKISDKFYGINQ